MLTCSHLPGRQSLDFLKPVIHIMHYAQRQQLGPAFPRAPGFPGWWHTRVQFSLLPCGAFFLLPLLTCQTFLFQRLEMCQQSSKERFFLRLFLVVHDRFHVQDARELFRAWDSEHVKDQTSRQIVHCNLFAVCELKYVPLWAS